MPDTEAVVALSAEDVAAIAALTPEERTVLLAMTPEQRAEAQGRSGINSSADAGEGASQASLENDGGGEVVGGAPIPPSDTVAPRGSGEGVRAYRSDKRKGELAPPATQEREDEAGE